MKVRKFNRLLKKIQRNRSALTEIYNYFYPLTVIYINRSFHGKLDGRDIAQQLFLTLMTTAVKEYVRYPVSWIFKIAERIAIKNLRKENNRKEAEQKAAVPDREYMPEITGTEILDGLRPKTRQIMYLHYWERYTLKEIAVILSMNYSTVKSAHRSAKISLKKSKQKEIPL